MQIFRKIDTTLGWALNEGAKIMFWIFSFVALIVCLVYQLRAASFRYQLDYGEAPLVDQAMRLVHGQNIYRTEISTPPYTISNYPPLYVTLLALSVKLLGPAATFTVGRVLSILSVWLASLCVALIIYNQTRDRFAAATAGVVLLAFPYVVTWSSLLRIDSVALVLSLAGLAVLVAHPTSNRHLIVASLLLVSAIYTRQSYALAAPFAGFIWLLSQEKRKAFSLALWVGGFSAILFLIFNAATHGGFYFNIITANVNEFKMDNLKYHWNRLREIALILLIFGGASLFLIRRLNPLWTLVAPYLLGALISAITIGKIGSNVNYLLELCAALSLAAGVVIATSQRHISLQSVRAMIIVALVLGIGRMVHFTLRDYASELMNRWTSLNQLSELSTIVAETPGEILADEYMGMLTLQGRPLTIQPFEVTQLAWAGKWDQTPLLNSINNKEYAAIIIYDKPWAQERWTQEMFKAVARSYVLTDIIAENKVYRVLQRKPVTKIDSCSGAAWQIPSTASLGIQLRDRSLDLFGQGNEGDLPVYAPADGLLTRLSDRTDALAIQHDDPLLPGKKVWTVYEGMASADGRRSYIAEEFPAGSSDIPVKAGQLIGYQGVWSGKPQWPMWVHVHFSVIQADDPALRPGQMTSVTFLDPAPYLGLVLDVANQNVQSLRCNQP